MKALVFAALIGSTFLASAQQFLQIEANKAVSINVGQNQYATLPNNKGADYYTNSLLVKQQWVSMSAVLQSLNLIPKSFLRWDEGVSALCIAYWDRLYKNIQESVNDYYVNCMESSVARKLHHLFPAVSRRSA